jgi:hypothetical protein
MGYRILPSALINNMAEQVKVSYNTFYETPRSRAVRDQAKKQGKNRIVQT